MQITKRGVTMDGDILFLAKNGRSKFSKSQKAIADYILKNYDKVAFMTASKLGDKVGVSESTVVRFAAELGYDGYPEMRQALQEMIKHRLTSVQRIEVAKDKMNGSDIISTLLHADINNIRMTMELINRSDFDAAVDLILNAKKIYIVALRSSMALGSLMGYYFNLIFENVKLITSVSTSEMFEQLLRVSPGDIVIGISFPRYSTQTLRAMRYCKDMGAAVIGITDGPMSPMVKHSSISLFAQSDMLSFVDSLVAPLSLINALIAAVGTSRTEQMSQTFETLEHIWDEYSVYEKTDNQK